MSTSKEFLGFISEQLSPLEEISIRSMMGEYLIYYRGKVAAYLCDGRLLVKPILSAIKMLPGAEYDSIGEGGRKNCSVSTTSITKNFCKSCL